MAQRTDEWFDRAAPEYHERQFETPYRSTVAFCDWLEELGFVTPESRLSILDVGCGLGAGLHYMAGRWPGCAFLGVDLNPELVAEGGRLLERSGRTNCRLVVGDLYDLDADLVGRFDGVVSLQTLSWLPGWREPLDAMAGLRSKWLAFSSLVHEGAVEATIEVDDFSRVGPAGPGRRSHYNVYSLARIRPALEAAGFGVVHDHPFEIDVDLPCPAEDGMGTYTRRVDGGERLQFSGPLWLPWRFVAASERTT